MNEKKDKSPKKNKEWQLRLAGMMRTVRSLEAENKEKEATIAQLTERLREKQRAVESLQGRLEADRSRSCVMQPAIGSTAQRNRERELEKKVKELEDVAARDKAHMLRLNEVNMKLLGKLKAGDTEVEHFNRTEEEFHMQLKAIQQAIEKKTKRKFSFKWGRLKQLCQKIQEENDNLAKEKAGVQMQLIETKQQLADFVNDSNNVYVQQAKLCEMVKRMLQPV